MYMLESMIVVEMEKSGQIRKMNLEVKSRRISLGVRDGRKRSVKDEYKVSNRNLDDVARSHKNLKGGVNFPLRGTIKNSLF